jgi:hypothetical protein
MGQVKLTGKTLKGKNRVREHGEIWDVIQIDRQLGILIKPEGFPSDMEVRWVSTGWSNAGTDKDFEVAIVRQDSEADVVDDVTITMPLVCAANTATVIKARLHDLQDLREKYPDSPSQDDVFQTYVVALKAVNEVLPDDLKQVWVRS